MEVVCPKINGQFPLEDTQQWVGGEKSPAAWSENDHLSGQIPGWSPFSSPSSCLPFVSLNLSFTAMSSVVFQRLVEDPDSMELCSTAWNQ